MCKGPGGEANLLGIMLEQRAETGRGQIHRGLRTWQEVWLLSSEEPGFEAGQ